MEVLIDQRKLIERIAAKLTKDEPSVDGSKIAGVSVILKEEDFAKVLLVKRAEAKNDPWSGQIAFPGGKREEGDMSIRDTAIRETKEEVGIDLTSSSNFLGFFKPFRTHTLNMLVIPCVFMLNMDVKIVPSIEISSYRWFPLEHFSKPPNSTYTSINSGVKVELPAYRIDEYIIWGLTYRIIVEMMKDEE